MHQVWKFALENESHQNVPMPKDARIIHIGEQDDIPNIGAVVDPRAPRVLRRIRLAGTGHEILSSECGKPIGSVLLYDATLVYHAFDLGEVDDDTQVFSETYEQVGVMHEENLALAGAVT
jgi:hypothetical protein